MRILAIESSCDETSVAIATDEPRILSNVVASQHQLHDRFGGIVPEIASRAHVRQMLPVLDSACREAEVSLSEIDAIAVASEPGLPGSLIIGLSCAKTLSLMLQVPLVTVNHLEAHIYACRPHLWPHPNAGLHHFPKVLGDNPGDRAAQSIFPCVGLVVSGGHTSLYHCADALDFRLLGATTDDAAGEAFDKVAKLLGLDYPGGPSIQRAAQGGDPKARKLPRAFLHDDRLDFSFSGLKTAVLYALAGESATAPPKPHQSGTALDIDQLTPPTGAALADWAASFQEAVVEVLVAKAQQALQATKLRRLCVGGGVAANKRLRQLLVEMVDRRGAELFIPPIQLCTDNAAMMVLAIEKLRKGEQATLDAEVNPRPERAKRH